MRKHRSRGESSSRLWIRLAGNGGNVRRKIQLSFQSDRQTCLWQTASRPALKH